MSKMCTKCGNFLAFSEFSVRSDRAKCLPNDPSKYSGACQACQSLATKLKFFNITKEDSHDLRVRHKDCCAICGIGEFEARNAKTKHYGLYVDHCHETKQVRGLLCHSCNFVLGHAKDNTDILKAAISYLKLS